LTLIDKFQQTIEFGDFQTPSWFAKQVCSLLVELRVKPDTLIEPTCGVGAFLIAGLNSFPNSSGYGIEINADYAIASQQSLASRNLEERATIINGDFFQINWDDFVDEEDQTLFIGNPPWVTNSALSKLQSKNLPQKSNFNGLKGIEAITGSSSNFDISEWMLLQLLSLRHSKRIALAMLCKTSVVRRLLKKIWDETSIPIAAKIFRIDSKKVFSVSVDACLLYIDVTDNTPREDKICEVYSSLDLSTYEGVFGYRKNNLIAKVDHYDRWKHLEAETISKNYRWRSGIKHDCSDVMELQRHDSRFYNKQGAIVDIEDDYLFPMLKSSDVARWPKPIDSNRWMLVTQRSVGQETNSIKLVSPKTWAYLNLNSHRLDARKSSIYKGKPRFSVFGIGRYSFTRWKIAISGLYKSLNFALIGPHEEKPIVLDDTCYILACESKQEAQILHILLNSEPASEFFKAHIFWDAKRPITTKLLNRLDIDKLAEACGMVDKLKSARNCNDQSERRSTQLQLLERGAEYTAT